MNPDEYDEHYVNVVQSESPPCIEIESLTTHYQEMAHHNSINAHHHISRHSVNNKSENNTSNSITLTRLHEL